MATGVRHATEEVSPVGDSRDWAEAFLDQNPDCAAELLQPYCRNLYLYGRGY